MQALVISLMAFVILSLLLKMTFYRRMPVVIICCCIAIALAFSWPLAISQSKNQIADWLSNPAMMADTAVLLFLEIALQMTFCIQYLARKNESEKKLERWLYKLLYFFPGLLHLAVFFSLLVYLIFMLPGVSFPLIAWSLAAIILVFLLVSVWGIGKLLSENEARLEMLFLVNLIMAVLGVVATVNGRTAVAGFSEVNVKASLLVVLLLFAGGICGILLRRFHFNRIEKNKKFK